jgi:hypothetical protein
VEQKTKDNLKEIAIKVRFEGIVTVMVPPDALLPEILAQKIALSRALATIDNPDAPDEDASAEYAEEIEKEFGSVDEDEASAAWDETLVEGIGGTWEVVADC